MTATDYKATRKRLGTQAEVAALLGVDRVTVARRETGKLRITDEAALALDALQARRGRPTRKKRSAMQAPNTEVTNAGAKTEN